MVIDCFSGVGGNTIQFTKVCSSVIAIDIDPLKIKMAVNNATVYGVVDRVDYVVGDFINLALKADILFLSPPWGGPMYNKVGRYSLFRIARSITPNIIMFLPRNIDLEQLEELARLSSPPLTLEIEENYVQGKIKAIKAYFSCSAKKNLTFHLSESPTELESDLRQVLKIVQNSETTIKKLVLDLEASFDRKMDKLTKEIKEIKTLISRFNTRW
ncbi:trimethylguanosine synthase isoform X2 [Brassica napus]|uniref:trimethylguanosine synthase isoform X2 n=1 Tax=Brassica napus TaxID=3708 RepID=UPI000BBE8F42|nr:trimethylguanosine synthase isoform X2 [Brassica napus]